MNKYYIIALSDDHPDVAMYGEMYWCGYVSQGKTHRWIVGDAGLSRAVRFLRAEDARCAGVSGPNVPHPPGVRPMQPQDWPNRGVKILEIAE